MGKGGRTKKACKEGDVLVGEEVGRCHFCGGVLGQVFDPPGVTHSMPMCEQYEYMEPLEFLRANRQS